jgi:flagellar L-ring protein precursor FlgH
MRHRTHRPARARPRRQKPLPFAGPMVFAGVFLLLAAGAASVSAHAENLYDPATFRALTADGGAHRIGDVVTVQIFENATASSSADTATRRSNGIDASLRTPGGSRAAGLEIGADFDGGGQTRRANRLLTTISVTVREVLPNGDLRLAGEQLVTVNDEPQRVSLEGRARPRDISEANVVLSTRLADARISYIGEGDLAERNRRPWWRRLFDLGGF